MIYATNPPLTTSCGGSHSFLTFLRCFNVEVKNECSCGAVVASLVVKEKIEKVERLVPGEKGKNKFSNIRFIREFVEKEKEKEREKEKEKIERYKVKGSENKYMVMKEKRKKEDEENKGTIEKDCGAPPHTPLRGSEPLKAREDVQGGKSKEKRKVKRKAVITARDIAIMREINRHGFMGAVEIARAFKINKTIAYYRLQKMTESGLLKHERVLFSYPGVYWLTFTGRGACQSELSTISTPSAGTFEHNMKLLTLSLNLKERYVEKLMGWQTPRELMAQKFSLGSDTTSGFKAMKSHTPDALLTMDIGDAAPSKIALELELTAKSTPRLKGIVENYAAALRTGQINRVIYYCASEAIKQRVIKSIVTSGVANMFQVVVLNLPSYSLSQTGEPQ